MVQQRYLVLFVLLVDGLFEVVIATSACQTGLSLLLRTDGG